MPTSSVRYWWLSKVAKPIYFAYNIGFVSSNRYELQSENKSQQNAVSYPQKQKLFLIHKKLLIHKNKSFSYFSKEDKHTNSMRLAHIKMQAATVLCFFISVVREISDFVHHDNKKLRLISSCHESSQHT